MGNYVRKDPNLEGKIFGELTVIKFDSRDELNKRIWLCNCSCGNTTKVPFENLYSGNTKSCGCQQIRKPLSYKSFNCNLCGASYEAKHSGRNYCSICSRFATRFYTFMRKYNLKNSLKMRNLAIEIIENKYDCNICGKPLDLQSFSFDHILPISRGGLDIIENIQFTHWKCNRIKNSFTTEELIRWCKNVVKFHEKY